ncbi:hypothetical protein K8S19_08750 [bacterium]|nr:hypothetical protein [bacterium]
MKKIIIVIAICLLASTGWAMTDDEYSINERHLNSAGGLQSNTTYTLLGSLGETIIGSMNNDVHLLISGFLQAISVFNQDDIKAKLPEGRIAWAVNNKFNPTQGEETVIQFRVGSERKRVTIKIYNLLGEFVKTVVDQEYDPLASNTGNPLDDFWSVVWQGLNTNHSTVGSGIYVVVVQIGNSRKILKVAVVK